MKKKNTKLLIISVFTIGYMLAAIAWWSVLLHRKIEENYTLKKVMPLDFQQDYEGKSNREIVTIDDIKKEYIKERTMIYGEFSVFIITLLICSWLIYRAIRKELATGKNQKNFLLSVTHELKSPVTSLNLAIDTLKKPNLTSGMQSRLLANAKEDTQRLESLISNILFSAKLEGNYIFNFENIELNTLIGRIIKKISTINKAVNIQFENNALDTAIVKADKEALLSVFNNIIENAIKYSPDTPELQIQLEKNSNNYQVKIIDKGIGIAERERGLVFDKFYRVGNEETRQSKGTGLGLYIANEIITAHKGSIAITANQPKGSIFCIQIPTQNA